MISSKSTIPGFAALLLLAACTFLAACNQENKIRGDAYIPRDKLVLVLADIHLMDGITNDMHYYRKFNPTDSIDLYGSIFEKYGINREKYSMTIEAYSKHPELLDEVYDEVLMRLNMLHDEIENKEEVKKEPVRDNIENR